MADDCLSGAQADGLVVGGTAAPHGRFAVAIEAGRTCRKGRSLA